MNPSRMRSATAVLRWAYSLSSIWARAISAKPMPATSEMVSETQVTSDQLASWPESQKGCRSFLAFWQLANWLLITWVSVIIIEVKEFRVIG
ncbi:MAG: hypothetical protein ACSLFE_10230 [Gemmatimonadaceae bacterium]